MDTRRRPQRKAGKAASRRDPEATRLRVLAVARQQFAEHGLAGARVDVIARLARVNQQALYYHFASKEGLFSAALDDGYEEFRKLDRQLEVSVRSPTEVLSELISINFEYLRRSPQLLAMIMDANRQKGRLLHRKRVQ